MRRPTSLLLSLASAAILLVVLAAVAYRARAGELRDLAGVDELRALVDHDQSVPRLVLLLSPT